MVEARPGIAGFKKLYDIEFDFRNKARIADCPVSGQMEKAKQFRQPRPLKSADQTETLSDWANSKVRFTERLPTGRVRCTIPRETKII